MACYEYMHPIMLPSECFPSMLAMQFSYIPVMSILVIWALIQLVLPPYHSDGRLKEPIYPYALLRSGILRDDQIVDCSYLTFGTFCGCFCNISIPFFLSFFLSFSLHCFRFLFLSPLAANLCVLSPQREMFVLENCFLIWLPTPFPYAWSCVH